MPSQSLKKWDCPKIPKSHQDTIISERANNAFYFTLLIQSFGKASLCKSVKTPE